MRKFTLTAFFVLGPLVLVAASDEPAPKLEWQWSEEKTTLDYSIKQHLQDYDVERVRENVFSRSVKIYTKKDDLKVNRGLSGFIYCIADGHDHTVFTRLNDTLYIAEYSPIATGCKVVALDLKTAKELWTTRLQGIGPTRHSKYRNRINIETDGKRIIINGDEAHGRYVEHLDIKTGKTLANKKLDAD